MNKLLHKLLHKLSIKIRDWLGINKNESKIHYLTGEINQLRYILKERTEYHLDVHQYTKHNSQVILIGKFRNNDFVKCYNIPDQEFQDLIQHCRELEKYSHRGKIDAFPTLSAAIKHTI